MILGCHQPNFIPWFPFFEKMVRSDVFVILRYAQFEKNGWQNRCKINGKWWSNPITHGLVPISEKKYSDGQDLLAVNLNWIYAIAGTLGIDTNKIVLDFKTEKRGTERLVEICQHFKCDEYLTNPEATEKYLDIYLFEKAGIKIIPFIPTTTKHVFELFSEIGIEKTKEILKHEKENQERT